MCRHFLRRIPTGIYRQHWKSVHRRKPTMNKAAMWLAALCFLAMAAQAANPSAVNLPTASDNLATPALAEEPKAEAAAPETGGEKRPPVFISMDLTDVDLPVLIKFISEQTKKNFIFDERVQGKITIISPRKIAVDEAYNVFLSVLALKGYTTAPLGNAIKIVPLADVKQENLPTDRAGILPSSEFVTRLVPLQYIEAAEVMPFLTPLVSKGGFLNAFSTSNTLLFIDSSANTDRLLKILGELDVAGAAGMIRIVPLRNASAADVVKTLDALYQEAPATGTALGRRAGRPGRAKGVAPPRSLADGRTNSVIVLAAKDLMPDIEELIGKLDVPAPENTGKINVYYLENSDAEEMAKVLASFSEKKPAPTTAAAVSQPVTVKGVISAELEGGVKIAADKTTNSLIIIASPNDYQTLVDVIRKLDIRRRQVYVEALIMEISLDKGLDVGVEFRGAGQTSGEGAVISGTNFDFTGNVNSLLSALSSGNVLSFSGTGMTLAGTVGNVKLSDGTEIPAITAVFRAAQSRSDINVLSSPNLLTMDNKEAEIVVGQNVPIITSQTTNTTNTSNITNTIERKDVGITLRLTPHIHESDFVNLDIAHESSAIKENSQLDANIVGVTTTKRSVKTSVLVHNGDTVVLGGMMQETLTVSQKQVPLLGDIPLLGYLFRYKSASRSKTNLMVFLTPRIIKESKEIAELAADRRKKMDTFIEQNKGEVEGALPP